MKTLKGTIVSDKMAETVIVEVTRLKKHPKYERRFRVSKRYKAHNPGNVHKTGEKVVIAETRPMSKTKHFIIL